MMGNDLELGVEEISFYYQEMLRSNLIELEIETPKGKLVLKRATLHDEPAYSAPARTRRRTAEPQHSAPQIKTVPETESSIRSPITGVFYRSASPQSPPFVKEGDQVSPGSTLCIIEAMKVMNEIKADSRCKIVRILVENGKPVTQGQALFQFEPA